MFMTVICVAVSVDSVAFYAVFHGMEIHEFLIFDQKSFRFPMEWDWGNGFKIRENSWSYIAVKLRVRRIPVCWTHLEFWETFDSSIYFGWMLHDV